MAGFIVGGSIGAILGFVMTCVLVGSGQYSDREEYYNSGRREGYHEGFMDARNTYYNNGFADGMKAQAEREERLRGEDEA